MAAGKVLPKRVFHGFKITFRSLPNIHRHYLSSPSPDSGDKGFFRRFLEARSVYRHPDILSLPVGEHLKLKGFNTVDFDVDANHPTPSNGYRISLEEARKILRSSQIEKLKAKLRDIPHSSISYAHYFQICLQLCHHNQRQAAEFANLLDHSGNVIVFGNVVFLRPEQVAKTLESLVSESIAKPDDPRRKELEKMERQKTMIDEKAKAQVRGELYCGLGFLTVQTLGLMRLTFWELSWDVMEPICFFMTSLYFSLAYIFFLRTSKEPTFQGYFQTRFRARQQRLIKIYNLDIQRYNELCKACYPACCSPLQSQAFPPFNHDA
ncbi:hypothetical protein VNO78_00438 [Psophocarpus tetragonolobus]|uniref:Calcium uniporter protein C-terminal domain-containing protein n=1 Tax=Psophocarpus tetragonolobus TaxID=3891 RepID=A0AAN9SX43_PSOTE